MIFAHLIQAASSPPTDASALERSISASERVISALDSEVKTLEISSVPWEHLLPWFTGIVVLGVAMEWWVIWHERGDDMQAWRRGTIRAPDRPSTTKFIVEAVSILFIAGGIVGELGIGLKIASINNALRGKSAELRSKNAELRSDSDQLLALVTQQAGDANRRAAEANRKSEDEQLARVKIEAAVAFRSLDDQQKRDIGNALTRFGSITAASMWFANGSAEAELFADDIAEALRFAHIHTTTVGGIMEIREGGGNFDAPIESANTGVDISSTSNPVARELADALFKELTSRGFDAKHQPDPKSQDNPLAPLIWVTVQARPKGPQGELKLQADRRVKTSKNTKSHL